MTRTLCMLLLMALLAAGCKKNTPTVYATESFPQKVILVIENDNDPTFYDYLSAQAIVLRRAEIEKTDDAAEALYNSSHAPDCVWIAHLSGNLIYFQLASDTSRYLKAVQNRLSDEYMLVANTGKGTDGSHLFDRHHIKSENGVTIFTIESSLYPNHYFSHEGVTGEGNAVRLNQHSDEKTAVKVRWYSRIY